MSRVSSPPNTNVATPTRLLGAVDLLLFRCDSPMAAAASSNALHICKRLPLIFEITGNQLLGELFDRRTANNLIIRLLSPPLSAAYGLRQDLRSRQYIAAPACFFTCQLNRSASKVLPLCACAVSLWRCAAPAAAVAVSSYTRQQRRLHGRCCTCDTQSLRGHATKSARSALSDSIGVGRATRIATVDLSWRQPRLYVCAFLRVLPCLLEVQKARETARNQIGSDFVLIFAGGTSEQAG